PGSRRMTAVWLWVRVWRMRNSSRISGISTTSISVGVFGWGGARKHPRPGAFPQPACHLQISECEALPNTGPRLRGGIRNPYLQIARIACPVSLYRQVHAVALSALPVALEHRHGRIHAKSMTTETLQEHIAATSGWIQ